MSSSQYEFITPEFRDCVNVSAKVEKLYEGCVWAEGPAYFPAHRILIWSDIPNNRMLRWDEVTGTVGIFRQPSNYTNGNTVDREGRLLSCEHGTGRVVRIEHDGTSTVLAEQIDGKRFNSPNDVVVKADGTVWFTDPSYGILSDFEGDRRPSEIGGDHVYRIDVRNGEITRVAEDFCRPNGLAFSPDERTLYIVDSGGERFPRNPRHIRAFAVSPDGVLSGGGIFAECTCGSFDGIRLDEFGRIWASAGDGVHVYATTGTLLGKIRVPEEVSNLTFGGARRNRLFITASTSVYSVLLPVKGAKTL